MNIKRTRIIAISSGKGGVGKTFLTLQLAAALVDLKKQVVLFDGDFGLANVHVLLGLKPENDVSAVVAGQRRLQDILIEGPRGIRIIPGASGLREMAELDAVGLARLLQGVGSITPLPDYILIDTGAGIGPHVTTLARLADILMVVVRDEAASLADAYGLIKVMHRDFGLQRIEIVVNDSTDSRRADEVFQRLNDVTTRFLGLPVSYAGTIPRDAAVTAAARRRQLLLEYTPKSPAGIAINKIAARVVALPAETGEWSFLVDQMAQVT